MDEKIRFKGIKVGVVKGQKGTKSGGERYNSYFLASDHYIFKTD